MNNPKPMKISVQVWRDLIPKLEKKIRDACLRRDAYLAAVVGREVKRLDSDITEPSSEQAHAFIAESIGRLPRKQVAFTLDASVIADLNSICQEKRIVRDAFFNRLIFWLVASPRVVDRILGNDWLETLNEPNVIDVTLESIRYPFDDSVVDLLIDPLWSTHRYFEHLRANPLSGSPRMPGDSFYTRTLNDKILKGVDLTGLNTYLHDIDVPGTQTQKDLDGEWELLPPTNGRT